MPLQRVSLLSFLNSAKTALANVSQLPSPVTFVIGNESADLDSLCCAVLLAYFRTYTSKSNNLYIPLSNIPRADLSLRPELIPVLSRANLTLSDLITLTDFPPTNQSTTRIAPEKTRWILVDHNALQGELGKLYGSSLVGCIDHHEEENKVPKDGIEEPRIVRKSGSCSSLVVEYCRDAWDSLAAKSTEESKVWDTEVASLALGPVVIDTTNLTSKSKTVTTDIETVKYLEKLIKARDKAFSTEDYFKKISHAKEDIGSLSLAGILRKDYKQWTQAHAVNLGVSSVVKNLSFLLEKAKDNQEFLEIMRKHAEERGLSMCCIMTTSHNDDIFKRELFLWGMNEKGVKAAKKFEAESKESLGLKQWKGGSLDSDGDGQWRRCWWQERVENSRKQVAPLLRTAIEQAA